MGPNKSEIDGSQCCGWVCEAREGAAGGVGLYYIKIFFFSNVIIIYYTIQKTRGR